MKATPKISIIIPSYNKIDYIKKTLNSILNQNYPNLEIIIQDGASTDGSVQLIKSYVRKFPKIIKLESKKDKGQVDAINKGLKKATGDILTYINADDLYKSNSFKAVANTYLNNKDSMWFVGECDVVDKNGKTKAGLVSKYKNILLHINKYYFLLILNYFMQPSVFLTRKAIKRFGYFSGTKKFVMEYALWLKIGRHQMPTIIDKKLASFRMAGDNISSLQFNDLLETDYKIIKRYSKDKVILSLHKLHNLFRIFTVKYLI